ncbi:MAG: hypothetical protein Aurels2KO_49810 [Aureliella sp.]
MTYLLRLLLAIGLGIVAASMNWVYMSSLAKPTMYVAVDSTLKAGQTIEENDLQPVPVPGDDELLRKSLIPYRSRSVLFGRKASRGYLEGDLVFSRDLVSDPALAQWDVIGPFELISVGERFKQTTGRTETLVGSTRGDTVTIAVDADFDLQTSRLLSVIAGDSSGAAPRRANDKPVDIVAVQVVPSKQQDQAARALAQQNPGAFQARNNSLNSSTDNMVYQTVSLQGIANVPGVLLEGDFIRFVVPSGVH